MSEEAQATNETLLNPWPTKKAIDTYRQTFVKENLPSFSGFIGRSPVFSDLSRKEKRVASKLMTRFSFGVEMVASRYGYKYEGNTFTYNINTEENQPMVAYHPESDEFSIRVDHFKKHVKNISKNKHPLTDFWGGIKQDLDPEDGFEIAGVEEMAHRIYYKEKGSLGRGMLEKGSDGDVRYLTSDIESRALNWKLAYASRYMPQYHNSLQETAREVRKLRIEAQETSPNRP